MSDKDNKALVPAWRAFVVRRERIYRIEDDVPIPSPVEEITVIAHTLQFMGDGVLAFGTISLDPAGELQASFRRVFREWLDVEEIMAGTGVAH